MRIFTAPSGDAQSSAAPSPIVVDLKSNVVRDVAWSPCGCKLAVAASRCCKIFRLSSRFRRDARSLPSVQQVASLAGHTDDLQAAEWWGGPAAATGSLLVREDSRPSFYSGAAAKDMKGRRKRGRGRRGGEVAVRRGSDRSRRPFDGRCHFSRRLLARVVLLGRLDSRVGRPRPMASRGSCCSPFRPSLRQQAARLRSRGGRRVPCLGQLWNLCGQRLQRQSRPDLARRRFLGTSSHVQAREPRLLCGLFSGRPPPGSVLWLEHVDLEARRGRRAARHCRGLELHPQRLLR